MRTALVVLAIFVGLFVIGSALWSDRRTEFYERALPEKLEVSELDYASDTNLLSAVLRGPCGGALFTLTDVTRVAIETDGLAFFETARQGRGYKDGPKRHHYSYAPWQGTPVPSNWIGDGKWAAGLHCLELSKALSRDVIEAAKAPGSYYTTRSEGELLVIPSMSAIVFTYFD